MRKAKWTKCSQWANKNSRKSAHLVFTCLFHQPLKNVCTILFFLCACVRVERQRLLTLLRGGDLLAMKGFGSRTDTRIQGVPSGRGVVLKCWNTSCGSKWLQSWSVPMWAAGILRHAPGWCLREVLGVQDFSPYLLKMLVLSNVFSIAAVRTDQQCLWGSLGKE